MGAVKRGWVRQFVVVCDFKLFLYDITADRSALPSVHVSQVIFIRGFYSIDFIFFTDTPRFWTCEILNLLLPVFERVMLFMQLKKMFLVYLE